MVSSDLDTIKLNNLHQVHMEKVYPNVFNSSVELNLMEMGAANPFVQIAGNIFYAKKTCEGHTISKGWQQLQNYPDNFEVFSNFNSYELCNFHSVSFSYSRLSRELMSSCIFIKIQLSTCYWNDSL